MDAILSPIILIDQEVTDIVCKINTNLEYYYRKGGTLSIIKGLYDMESEDGDKFRRFGGILTVGHVAYNDDASSVAEIELNITVRGRVDMYLDVLSDEQKEDIEKLAEFNLISLLYSYARAKVEDVTASTPYQKLTLPTINVSALFEESLNDE